jgi:Tetratricopeptide repeat
MRASSACPLPAVVERAYWTTREGRPLESREMTIHEHVMQCDACRDAWTEIEALAAIGTKIEPTPWTRGEELRTKLLSAMNRQSAPPPRAFARRMLILPATIAAALAIWWMWPAPRTPTPQATKYRGVVLEHEGARSHVVTEQPDEIVRLASGTISVAVPVLATTERFRVITGDDEIDATGAAFDATAASDRLVSLRVLHGEVKLLASGSTTVVRSGETWRATQLALATPPDAAIAAVPPVPVAIRTQDAVVHDKVRTIPAPPVDAPSVSEPAVDAAPTTPPPALRSAAQDALDAGWTALRAHDYASAAIAFERATTVTVDPNVLEDAMYWRGVALGRSGEVASAVKVLAAFVVAYPRSVRVGEANIILGWLYFERGDRGPAERHFRAALGDTSPRVRDAARTGLRASGK